MSDPGRLYRIRRRDIAFVIVIGLAEVGTLVAFVLLIRSLVAALAPGVVGEAAEDAWRTALWQAALLGLVAILHGCLRWIEFNVTESIGYRIVRDLRMRMYQHLQGMTPRQFQGRARGGLLLRFLGDLSMTRMWISRGILGGLQAGIVLVGTLSVLMLFNARMTLAIVATLSAGAAISLSAGRSMRRATRTMRRRRSLVMSNLDEQINAQSVVQAFGRTSGEYSRLSHQNDTLTRSLIRMARLRGLLRGISTAFSMLIVGAVLTIGLFEVRRGTATIAMVVAFVIVARQLGSPVRRLGLAHDYWHRAQVSQQKVSEFLRSSSRPLDGVGQGRLRVRGGAIEFDSVNVEGAVNDLTLSVEPGQFVAVTGPGGAGKSTMLGLIARMVEADSGSITIDGQRLDQVSIRSTAHWIGVVGPDLPLMRGTVRRNLTYGAPDASPEEVDRVLNLTGLDELLTELPDGISTWVTEGGRNLSVSQRQWIALGRAFMNNPPILLLDEPTSGLDTAGKEAFLRLASRHQGTTLCATHDPREIAMADRVVILNEGRISQVLSGDEYRDQLWFAEQKGQQWSPSLVP